MAGECRGCGREKPNNDREQWWHCSNYFKISGTFCSRCYDKISHNSYQQPERPNDYLMMLMKLGVPV